MAIAIRQPAVAGRFYPDSAHELSRRISSFRSEFSHDPIENLDACIMPHAGMMYSGPVAATLLASIEHKQPKTIIICGPSHYHGFEGISIYNGSGYQTPLGTIPVDTLGIQMIQSQLNFCHCVPSAHDREHCIEVLLPFFQATLSSPFQLIPIVTGTLRFDQQQQLGRCLKSLLHKDTLWVASSDFSHFYSQETAEKMDAVGLDAILQQDPQLLADRVNRRETELCGASAVLALLTALQDTSCKSHHLGYQTSGAVSGDYDSVVGYHSIGFFNQEAPL